MTEKEIHDLFGKFGLTLDRDDVWTVQKAVVVKHKALERLSGRMGIAWEPPVVIRSESDEAVILARGKVALPAAESPTGATYHRCEWSVGEAKIVPMLDTGRKNNWGKPIYEPQEGSIGNYQITPKQAAYPWAMAEKRAKDRVILKLADLHGAFSEDEADDFKTGAEAPQQSAPARQETPRAQPQLVTVNPADEADRRAYMVLAKTAIDNAEFADELTQWWRSQQGKRTEYGITKGTPEYDELIRRVEDTRDRLPANVMAAG